MKQGSKYAILPLYLVIGGLFGLALNGVMRRAWYQVGYNYAVGLPMRVSIGSLLVLLAFLVLLFRQISGSLGEKRAFAFCFLNFCITMFVFGMIPGGFFAAGLSGWVQRISEAKIDFKAVHQRIYPLRGNELTEEQTEFLKAEFSKLRPFKNPYFCVWRRGSCTSVNVVYPTGWGGAAVIRIFEDEKQCDMVTSEVGRTSEASQRLEPCIVADVGE